MIGSLWSWHCGRGRQIKSQSQALLEQEISRAYKLGSEPCQEVRSVWDLEPDPSTASWGKTALQKQQYELQKSATLEA